jgi:hypothetical protein
MQNMKVRSFSTILDDEEHEVKVNAELASAGSVHEHWSVSIDYSGRYGTKRISLRLPSKLTPEQIVARARYVYHQHLVFSEAKWHWEVAQSTAQADNFELKA